MATNAERWGFVIRQPSAGTFSGAHCYTKGCLMDPTERLANDLQELKKRFDEMSLRFAISEEREKRVDDKIDNMVAMMTAKIGGLEKSVNGWNTTGRWVLTVVGGTVMVILIRWAMSGQLAGF